jgi:hypothetical protein
MPNRARSGLIDWSDSNCDAPRTRRDAERRLGARAAAAVIAAIGAPIVQFCVLRLDRKCELASSLYQG